jgi:hypothetical protein
MTWLLKLREERRRAGNAAGSGGQARNTASRNSSEVKYLCMGGIDR